MSTADSLVILPPKRRSNIPDLVNDLARTLRGQQAEKDEKARYSDSVERQRAMLLAKEFNALRPEQKAARYAALDPLTRQYVDDPAAIPPPVLSDLEYRQQELAKERATKEQRIVMGIPEDLGAGGRDAAYHFATGTNPNAPISNANAGRFNYENQATLPPEVVQGQRIADKIDPTGQERIVHRDVTLPTTRADIAKTGAETRRIGAETAKTGAETESIVQGRTPGSPSQAAFGERVTMQEGAKAAGKASGAPTPGGDYQDKLNDRIIEKVDDLLPRITNTTAGPVGSVLKRVPGTPARDVAADINSLAANVAFEALQEMRQASKTGGALGQVSDKEGALLRDVLASIEQDQSPGNLVRNLNKIRQSRIRFAEAKAKYSPVTPTGKRKVRSLDPNTGMMTDKWVD